MNNLWSGLGRSLGLTDEMTCSKRVSARKVYDEKRKEYIVKKEITVGVNNECLGIEPDQLKECVSPFVAKYYDMKVMHCTLNVWKWGVIDELDSNGVLPSWITIHI